MFATDWLFIRDADCMWVRRSLSAPFEVVIHGPGNLRRIGSFESERELRAFVSNLQVRLVRKGWTLEPCEAARQFAGLPGSVH